MAGRPYQDSKQGMRPQSALGDAQPKSWPYVRAGDLLGSYRIREFLGRGGMGRVYRADGPDGPVALKLIHPQFLKQEDFLRRFMLEAGAGKRVHHQNVVRTYGCEVVRIGREEQAMLVMEHVHGRTLMDLSKDIGRVPDGFLRDIARGIASGLEAIHAAGVIHRDLKPENVMITDDNRIKIMDLGVARLRTEELRLSRTGHFVGSLLFAAPEQLSERGARSGPPADLYAIGLLLHVLASGEHPFPAGSAGEIINAHLNAVPKPLREVAPGCSRFLEAVTSTLLAKRPEARFASALALRETLEAAEASEWWLERRSLGPNDGTGSVRLPVRRVGPVRGRPAELRDLNASWRRAASGSGRVLLITGESGIGKSRLVDAFLEGQRLPRGSVGLAVAETVARPESGGAVRAALRGLLGSDPETLKTVLHGSPGAMQRVQTFLEAGVTSTVEDGPGALLTSLVDTIEALTRTTPRVLVFDDLERQSAFDQAVFRALARRVEDTALLLVGMARPILPAEMIEALSSLACVRHLALTRLDGCDAERMLGDMLESPTLAGRLAPELLPLAGGNPLFLTEVVETMKSTHVLARDPVGHWCCQTPLESTPVPATLTGLFNQRLDALPPETLQILEAAAVQGNSFSVALLARVLNQPVLAVLEGLRALGQDPQMVRGGGETRVFDPVLSRTVVLERLEPGVQRDLNERTAVALLAEAGEAERVAPRVTLHFLRADRVDRAQPHLLSATQGLVEAYEYAEALILAEEGIARRTELPAALVLGLMVERARILELLGRRDEERSALVTLQAYAEISGLPVPAAALDAHGRLLLVDGKLDEARLVFDQQLESGEASQDRVLEARARRNLGRVAMRTGEMSEARLLYERSLLLARAAGNAGETLLCHAALGVLFEAEGQNDRARLHIGRELELTARLGNLRDAARAHGSLARLSRRCGRFRVAQVHVDRQLALARQIGDRGGECQALRALGILNLSRGRVVAAREALVSAERVASDAGRELDVVSTWIDLARVHLYRGDETSMVRVAMRALSKAQRLRVPGLLVAALTLAGQAAEENDDLVEARDWYMQALDSRTPRSYVGGEIAPLFGLARVGRLQGRPDLVAGPLDQIVRLGESLELPGPWLVAEAMRAAALEQPARRLLALLVLHVDCLSVHERLALHLEMATATGDVLHLEEARGILDGLAADLGVDPVTLASHYSLYRRIPGCDGPCKMPRRAA